MKILVGYDESDASTKALSLAKDHAKVFNGQVHVAHSMEKGEGYQQEEIKDMERALERVKSNFQEDGVPCEIHLLIRGLSPGEDLVNFSIENEIDVIIIGIKKKSKVEK